MCNLDERSSHKLPGCVASSHRLHRPTASSGCCCWHMRDCGPEVPFGCALSHCVPSASPRWPDESTGHRPGLDLCLPNEIDLSSPCERRRWCLTVDSLGCSGAAARIGSLRKREQACP